MKIPGIPKTKLKRGPDISELFINIGLESFDMCVAYIHQLPYARNTKRGDIRSVLNEKRGTCSTKHALLKALADEQGIPISLVLGMFLTTPAYDSRVEQILKKYKIPAIPIAHTFIQYGDCYIDISFPEKIEVPEEDDIIEKYLISPGQIGKFKQQKYSDFIDRWISDNNLPYTREHIIDIRNSWVEFVSDNS